MSDRQTRVLGTGLGNGGQGQRGLACVMGRQGSDQAA